MEWNPEEPSPVEGAPAYFRRVWDPPPAPPTVMMGGHEVAVVQMPVPEGGLVIVGYGCRSQYAEDAPIERQMWRERRVMPGVHFSSMCPQGEWGTVPLEECEEITREEFFAALARIRS